MSAEDEKEKMKKIADAIMKMPPEKVAQFLNEVTNMGMGVVGNIEGKLPGKLFINGKEIGEVKDIKLNLPPDAKANKIAKEIKALGKPVKVPIHFKCMDIVVPPKEIGACEEYDGTVEGLKMLVVWRFVDLFAAYGIDPDVLDPKHPSAVQSVAYVVNALRAGHCVMMRREAVSITDNNDGTADVAHTFNAKALPKPAQDVC